MKAKEIFRDLLGLLPFSAELYWRLRNPEWKAFSRFNLDDLQARLPRLVKEVEPFTLNAQKGRKVFLFASFHLWMKHITLCGLALRGLGHEVTLGFLPYCDYDKPISPYDLRRQDLYARHVLEKAWPLLDIVPLLDEKKVHSLPAELSKKVKQVSLFDAQYTLQREDIRGDEPILQLRHVRNTEAARRAYTVFQKNPPDVVIVPNGMIQEYGAVYETARFLGIQAVTYEFGEHKLRTWLGQDRLVIQHDIDELWEQRKDRALDENQRQWLRKFLAGRQGLDTGEDFAHLWQKKAPEGGAQVRAALHLDGRPVVLLPTNVLGDSATLGLTLFSSSMTDWLQQVVAHLAVKPEVQVVVRIHPAETWTVGPSVAEVIHQVLPQLPEHIRLIGSKEKINTYDLMEIADLALVYTTTAGLEMATRGIPVLVSGRANYRKKGFTLDADTWEDYFSTLDTALGRLPGLRLSEDQIQQAWNYAYTYFAEHPRPFPWHLEKVMKDLDERSLSYVLSPEGRTIYEQTFQELAGMPMFMKESG